MIGKDQFAYGTGSNTTMTIIKCQHQWLKWLEDEDVDFIRVIPSISARHSTRFPTTSCVRS